MKAALVYTSTTPELIELVEKEVTKNRCRDHQSAGPKHFGRGS